MAAASAMVFFVLLTLLALVSAANPEAMASPSWMDWISPRYVYIACFILYNVYSLLVGGGSPEDKAFSEKFLAENKANTRCFAPATATATHYLPHLAHATMRADAARIGHRVRSLTRATIAAPRRPLRQTKSSQAGQRLCN